MTVCIVEFLIFNTIIIFQWMFQRTNYKLNEASIEFQPKCIWEWRTCMYNCLWESIQMVNSIHKSNDMRQYTTEQFKTHEKSTILRIHSTLNTISIRKKNIHRTSSNTQKHTITHSHNWSRGNISTSTGNSNSKCLAICLGSRLDFTAHKTVEFADKTIICI